LIEPSDYEDHNVHFERQKMKFLEKKIKEIKKNKKNGKIVKDAYVSKTIVKLSNLK
jgi:hypothetical protein